MVGKDCLRRNRSDFSDIGDNMQSFESDLRQNRVENQRKLK